MKVNIDNIIELNDEGLKEYQNVLLDIAKDIVSVFDNNYIDYSLSGGSILGAIRHSGFIPWDDDIDINIPRDSFEKLKLIFQKELGDKYYLQLPSDFPELGLMVVQIRKKGTVARRKYDWNSQHCGISIDIYIVENAFDNILARSIQMYFSTLISFVISSVRYNNNSSLPKEIFELEARQPKYTAIKKIVGSICRIVPLKNWISWCDYWNSKCKNKTSKMVAIPTGRKHFYGEIYYRSKMLEYRKAKFESEEFNIPAGSEDYLKEFYGNYMEIPPLEKREKHLFLELKYDSE